MAKTFRLIGSLDPTSRVDRWQVESPTAENPDGKVLTVGGPPVELDERQYDIGARYFTLEETKPDAPVEVQFVDQPGVEHESLSTDNPPDLGTAPDVGRFSKDEARAEVERLQRDGELQDVDPGANKDVLTKALRDHYGQGEA